VNDIGPVAVVLLVVILIAVLAARLIDVAQAVLDARDLLPNMGGATEG